MAVTFLVNGTVSPSVALYERTGVHLFVQLAGGAYAVVKGVGLQLLLQNAANSHCPAPQLLPLDILWNLLFAATKMLRCPRSILLSSLVGSASRKRLLRLKREDTRGGANTTGQG